MPSIPPSTTTDAPAKKKIVFDLSQMQPWREFAIILFDDEVHSQGEVIGQLMKALECSLARACFLMHQVEEAAQATIAIAPREKALHISGILRQIELQVQLRQIN